MKMKRKYWLLAIGAALITNGIPGANFWEVQLLYWGFYLFGLGICEANR